MKHKISMLQTDEGFSVWVEDLPGCVSQGQTKEEALLNIRSAMDEYLEVAAELALAPPHKRLSPE